MLVLLNELYGMSERDKGHQQAEEEATRYEVVGVQRYKSDTAANMRKWVLWSETQTEQRVQRVRHDRGGEYMNSELQRFYHERGIQIEPTAGFSPESNGIAERHNLTLLDMILPMLTDSADPAYGLPPLSNKFAAEAAIYANDLHNAKPAASATIGTTPHEGSFQRAVDLNIFQRFGSRVWVHRTGHRPKLAPRAIPGRFLGFERPFGSGIYRVLLDDGRVTQSQIVQFSNRLAGQGGIPACGGGGDGDHMSQAGTVDDTDDEDGSSVGPSNALPVNPATVEPAALPEPEPEQAQPQSGAQMLDAAAVAGPELGQARSQGSAPPSMQSANLPKLLAIPIPCMRHIWVKRIAWGHSHSQLRAFREAPILVNALQLGSASGLAVGSESGSTAGKV
jgi:hypothetical protein